ncbi:hypothetical protein ACHAWO_004842 [Cyclotella atomus]|uniref:Uncharacterized protein n=1 Tax=Cyclotella atomus TaxID=382360 RepID=A0ABD3PPX7_9STRA
MLLSHHPSYKLFRWNTIHGIDYPIADLPEQQRLTDLETQMDKGNHKSALQPEAIEHVTKAMHSNISLGYTIPITLDGIRHLKEAVVYLIGLQHQLTINENGAIIPKKRISHDLSNKQDLKRSINQRVDKHQLSSVLYGYALLPTWTSDDGHEIGALLTRLPFGSSPAPANFSVASDIICDLAPSNDLTQCEKSDPNKLSSPLQHLIPETKLLPTNIPFSEALEAQCLIT